MTPTQAIARRIGISLICCVALSELGLAEDQLLLQGVTKAEYSRAALGQLFTLRATVANETEQPQEGLLVANVVEQPSIQGATEVLILPGRRKQIFVTLQLPAKLAPGQSKLDIEVKLLSEAEGQETLMTHEGNIQQQKVSFKLDQVPGQVAMALLPEPQRIPDWQWPNNVAYSSYELLVASRISYANTRSLVAYVTNNLPIDHATLRQLDVLVLSDPKRLNESAAVESLKRFVNDGGRLWIMLDEIPCWKVRSLLGVGQAIEEVDQVELSEFTVRVNSATSQLSADDRKVQSAEALRLRRVVQTGGDVSHSIDSWPAAIWFKVGYGEIAVTTLESQGFIRPRDNEGVLEGDLSSLFEIRPWANELASSLMIERQTKPLEAPSASVISLNSDTEEVKVEYPSALIGNPVLPRSIVLSVLLGFIGLLCILGVWLWKSADLSAFGFAAPALALLVSIGLGVASSWNRRDIPETDAVLQVAQVGEDGHFSTVRQFGSVYLGSNRSMEMRSETDGIGNVDGDMLSGTARLISEQKSNAWKLKNTTWPTGNWNYKTEYQLAHDSRIAVGTLDENGLTLQLPKDLASSFSDPIIAYTPGGAMLGTLSADRIQSDGSLLAGGDRWLSQSLIDSEQGRRLDVYRSFFTGSSQTIPPSRTLFGWVDRLPGPTWNAELESKGAALVGMPIQLNAPEVAAPILVPSGLIALRRSNTAGGKTSAYDDRRGSWKPELSIAVSAAVEFAMPRQLVPFKALSIDIELDIDAPQRQVKLLWAGRGNQTTEIGSLDSPSVPWNTTISDDQILQDARDGVVKFILEVSPRTDLADGESSSKVVTWSVNKFRANIRGSRAGE